MEISKLSKWNLNVHGDETMMDDKPVQTNNYRNNSPEQIIELLVTEELINETQKERITNYKKFINNLSIEMDVNHIDNPMFAQDLMNKIDNLGEEELNQIINTALEKEPDKEDKVRQGIQTSLQHQRRNNNGKKPSEGTIAQICRKKINHYYPIINTKDNDKLWIYHKNEGIWKQDAESKIREVLVESLGRDFSKHIENENIEQIRGVKTEKREILGSDPEILPVNNGILELGINKEIDKSDRLRKAKPEDHAISKIPVKYDPEAECEEFKEFLNEVTDKEWKVEVLQEYVGYTLYRRQKFEKVLLLIGDGSNGKSVFLNTIKELLGKENINTASLHKITRDRDARADLYGKMANIHADISSKDIKDTSAFKTFTGGDKYVRARDIYEKSFKFTNYSKFIFSTNEIPESKHDKSRGFYRRWLVIKFPYTYSHNDDDGHRDADSNLIDKLTAEEELSGILTWAIEGLQRLLDQGRFSYPRTPDENAELWERMTNPIKSFADDRLTEKEDATVTKDEIYEAYKEYVEEHGGVIKSKNIFSKELKKVTTLETGKKRINGKRKPVYKGIELTEDKSIDEY